MRLPSHIAVANRIRARINSGDYAPGELLPGRRQLEAEYCAGTNTMQRAIQMLADTGLVRTEYGRGTFVAEHEVLAADDAFALSKSAAGKIAPLGVIGMYGDIAADSWNDAILSHWEPVITKSFVDKIANLGGRTQYLNRGSSDDPLRIPVTGVVRQLIEDGVTGILSICDSAPNEIEQLHEAGLLEQVPIVFASRDDIPLPVHTVCFSNKEAARQAASHLIAQGCRRLVFVMPDNNHWVVERLNGALEAIAAKGLAPSALSILDTEARSNPPFEDLVVRVKQAAQRYLADCPAFDGVIAASDAATIGFANAASDRDLIAGRDYNIVGFDDIPEAAAMGLSTMRPPLEQMGTEAAHLMARLIRGQAASASITLHSQLMNRDSSRRVFNIGIASAPLIRRLHDAAQF
ncbi:MAG: GntR family transcriptional regulator [Capsulimonadaceae bacterium]|nr:GntR family transcriptional regulator [Capsulimonadaceae bacterium]